MDDKEFEQLVEEGLAAIPERLRQKISNVAILIEDEPSPAVRRAQKLKPSDLLLGLYEGRPHTARQHYGVGITLPDRITIFRKPIEYVAGGSPDRIREQVRDTVWHEVAHHFGMDEPAVRAHENRRRYARKKK